MIEIELPWPRGLTPNTGRRTTMAARTGHEAADREDGRAAVSETVRDAVISTFGVDVRAGAGGKQREQLIPCEIEFCPPDWRWYDALNCHYRVKAVMDGVMETIGIDDARLWATTLRLGEAVRGGKVTVRIG